VGVVVLEVHLDAGQALAVLALNRLELVMDVVAKDVREVDTVARVDDQFHWNQTLLVRE